MKILIASPVRTSEPWQTEAFKHYLNSIDNLERPENAQVDRLFLLHNSPHLKEIVKEGPIPGGNQYIAEVETPDHYSCTEKTHEWKTQNLLAVAAMRNYLIETARVMGYDYYFMVDSDLVLHPKTLMVLIEAKKDIVAEAFWTKWTPEDIEAVNAWDRDTYSFFPDMETRFKQFRQPGLYQVGMTGACVLISKPVLEAKVNYDHIYNVSFWGEDRAFCIRAAVHGFEIWLDTHYPPVHLYRPSELSKYESAFRADELQYRRDERQGMKEG
jgi:hypothetical protein